MAETGAVRGPVCGIDNCRSRRYEEGEDGYLYCENGHRKGELLAGSDDDMFETAARKRTHKQKDDDHSGKSSKYLKGSRAIELYLKCLQLILRHQLWFLIHEQGLPDELETVVQDLWALRILGFETKISEQRQEFDSSQAFTASDTDTDAERDGSKYGRNSKMQATPNLVDCLVLCYLGTLTLRLPILPGDFYTWTTEKSMAYRGAIRLLPIPMRDQLPATYHDVLDPNSLLSPKSFYSSLINIQTSFQVEHGIVWPPLNIPILLFRLLKELALPLEVYHATLRLASLLGYDFAFHSQTEKAFSLRQLPEAQLFGCLVVCVKLLHPFDGSRRYPKSTAEPTATRVDWSRWLSTMQRAKEQAKGADNRYTIEELTKIQGEDVFSMDGAQLDQYLDFYLDNFVDEPYILSEGKSSDFQHAMYQTFPVKSSNPSPPVKTTRAEEIQRGWDVVQSVQSEIESQTIIAEDDGSHGIRRPGQDYVIYKTESDLPEEARAFYGEVARIGGLSMEMLISVVFSTEMRVRRWKKKQREQENAQVNA
ncbi:hypothetical protein DM02DRAFT_590451 [Periconia macrospinosa]|uniref:Uncharacterized protein n=1 Tax=Periconia macrospinosa TaxID=97972 RepID=A0A2V1DXE2_9PLEO|nr:hypothetical protein DM02DRAFT_590451 [Periconia macrospinosa]